MAKKPNKKIPKEKPKEFWLRYRNLLPGMPNWGEIFPTEKEKKEAFKHPTDSILQFAFLTRIVDLLVEIKEELKRERKIN